jgi:3-isopropylmalate/(R)-2-methylmalate dehydratase small subunit
MKPDNVMKPESAYVVNQDQREVAVKRFESSYVILPIDNIDTDQIIPARFLKTISKSGLGDQLFNDWRYDESGAPKSDFVLNRPDAVGAQVLVAGDNFGCGSSREHAPWALIQYGFRAVISTSFADIFKQNSLKNGLLPIVVPRDIHAKLLATPNAVVDVNLETQTLTLADGSAVEFPIDAFSKHCLLEGVDELGYILQQTPAIDAYEARRSI